MTARESRPGEAASPTTSRTPTIASDSDCNPSEWRQGNWGGRFGEAAGNRSCRPRKPAPQAHPWNYQERPLIIWDVDCTALWHQCARNEMKRLTRHLPQSYQNVALAFVADCTTGGQYYWSQERLARRAGRHTRETACRALRRLTGDLELVHIPKKQRHYNSPKTLTLAAWFMTRVRDAVMRALCRSLGHTRKAKPSVGAFPRGAGWPSYEEFVRRFPKRTKYRGGWMVCCPAHDDRHPSLSISEGRGGRILFHCHAGCTHEKVRTKLNLPPPQRRLNRPVTLRAGLADALAELSLPEEQLRAKIQREKAAWEAQREERLSVTNGAPSMEGSF
jgi:hypothetical protein